MSIELTNEEEKWIKSLKRVCKKCPKTLWLFNDGTMTVMKYPEDRTARIGANGCVNQEYRVDSVPGIYSDGGDW